MRALTLVLVGVVILQVGGSVGASLQRPDPQRTRATGSVLSALRRTAGEFLVEDPSLCFSLRQNEDQPLLCHDRRGKFNFNPFGLRFGKRYDSYVYRRAVKKAQTDRLSPLPVSSLGLAGPP
ncbi:kisspeptin 2 [Antennarius striatus]|uniref:kisspeptin 2 n=1 Tax=Antennarius striatus TaxID=241820 RepID=UPI0035B175F3